MSNEEENTKAPRVVFYLPKEKFVFRSGGVWHLDKAVSAKAIPEYLRTSGGMTKEQAKDFVRDQHYEVVVESDVFPGMPEIVKNQNNELVINLWHPPTLVPKEGPFPLIDEVITWLTADPSVSSDDPTMPGGLPPKDLGKKWLMHWLAAKVQAPAFAPKVATLFVTQQGAGKGILFRCIQEMLGSRNCAVIQQGALENKFNARWIGKLAILADEVKANEQTKDISDQLKVLIDGAEIEKEAKGVDQALQKNRLLWVFASNDAGTPIKLEAFDRRFTVFSNLEKVPTEYVKRMNAAFEKDRKTLTPEFKAQLQGFAHHLHTLEVDHDLIARPANTYGRWKLIHANAPAHETFIAQVNAEGINHLLAEELKHDYDARGDEGRAHWDLGDAISVQMAYRCYVRHCKNSGNTRPVKLPKFSALMKNLSGWRHKKGLTTNGRRVYAFEVPREVKST